MEGTYFVASNDYEEGPELIYFSPDEAFSSGYTYIDVFDEDGDRLMSYKLLDDFYDDYDKEETISIGTDFSNYIIRY